jgi:hypothetical protein
MSSIWQYNNNHSPEDNGECPAQYCCDVDRAQRLRHPKLMMKRGPMGKETQEQATVRTDWSTHGPALANFDHDLTFSNIVRFILFILYLTTLSEASTGRMINEWIWKEVVLA